NPETYTLENVKQMVLQRLEYSPLMKCLQKLGENTPLTEWQKSWVCVHTRDLEARDFDDDEIRALRELLHLPKPYLDLIKCYDPSSEEEVEYRSLMIQRPEIPLLVFRLLKDCESPVGWIRQMSTAELEAFTHALEKLPYEMQGIIFQNGNG